MNRERILDDLSTGIVSLIMVGAMAIIGYLFYGEILSFVEIYLVFFTFSILIKVSSIQRESK